VCNLSKTYFVFLLIIFTLYLLNLKNNKSRNIFYLKFNTMKIYYLFSILIVGLNISFAKNIQDINKRNGVKSKSKRAETSSECKYINSILGKDDSYNCCGYEGIKCVNGQVIEL